MRFGFVVVEAVLSRLHPLPAQTPQFRRLRLLRQDLQTRLLAVSLAIFRIPPAGHLARRAAMVRSALRDAAPPSLGWRTIRPRRRSAVQPRSLISEAAP